MKRYIGITIFITLFISTVSIIAILTARGYNFAGTEIKESGILNITSNPNTSEIYINNEKKTTTPNKIELISGEYEIKVVKDGYSDWKKKILIEPTIVTDIAVTLFPEELKLEQLTFTNIDNAFFSENGSYVIYTIHTEPNKGIWLAKLEKSIFELSSSPAAKITNLDILPEYCIENSNMNIIFSSSNNKVIISCNSGSNISYTLLDIENTNNKPININEEINFNPQKIDFSFNDDNLFIYGDNFIGNFNTNSKELNLISLFNQENPVFLTPFKDTYLILEKSYDGESNLLYQLDSNLKKNLINISDKLVTNSIKKIYGSKYNTFVVITTDNNTSSIINLEQIPSNDIYLVTESLIDILSWSNDGKAFLYTEDNILKSAIIKTEYNVQFKVETYTLIENYSIESFDISWTKNSGQIIIYDFINKTIYITDKDSSNHRILYSNEAILPLSYKLSENETFLVLILKDDKDYSNLYSLKLKI